LEDEELKLVVYWGCKIPATQYAYEMSVRQVLPHLGVELADLKGVSCCGGPMRSINNLASMYLSARNLALASKSGGEGLLVPCNECHFMLTETKYRLDNDEETHKQIEKLLSEEELEYSPDLKIWHIVDLLHSEVKVETVKSKVKKPLKGFRFAVHPGCQIIRPSEIGRVDSPENPKKLDALVKALGAETLDYTEKLDCCGAALMYSHEEAALSLAGSKLKVLQTYKVDGFVDTCPYCHAMYDDKQDAAAATVGGKLSVSVLYYTQLLGIALGIDQEKLGLHLNQSKGFRT
jgi:heterodisulfide reductase subunit B